MGSTTLSSREFNQDASRAKKATAGGPVFITDRGRPAHVLMSIVDLLSADEHDAIEFEAPRASGKLFRPADLS